MWVTSPPPRTDDTMQWPSTFLYLVYIIFSINVRVICARTRREGSTVSLHCFHSFYINFLLLLLICTILHSVMCLHNSLYTQIPSYFLYSIYFQSFSASFLFLLRPMLFSAHSFLPCNWGCYFISCFCFLLLLHFLNDFFLTSLVVYISLSLFPLTVLFTFLLFVSLTSS